MENTEGVVRAFLTDLVSDALGGATNIKACSFAQGRFVRGDPATIVCTWSSTPDDGKAERGGKFHVCFSGEVITNFVTADENRLAKLRTGAMNQIRARQKAFDPAGAHPDYPFQIMIDRIPV